VLGVQPHTASVGGQVLMHGVDLLQMNAGERERIRGTCVIYKD
jgi:ABC-type glutathione transport system ATPase component